MFHLLSSIQEFISPSRAAALLELNNHPSQRRLNPRHVDELAAKMRNGLFRVGNVALAELDGDVRLMNGQHTLHAITKVGQGVQALVENYRLDCTDDFSLLFRQFDMASSTRRQSDMNRIEADVLGLTWPARTVNLVVSGLSLNAGNYRNCTADDRVGLLVSNIKQGTFVAKILDGGVRHLLKKAVVAAMIQTWNCAPNDAELFWTAVRDGEGLHRTMPEYHLREFLRDHDTREGARRRATASDHEYRSRCITAWNVRRAGGVMKALRYSPDKDVPRPL